MNVLQWLMIGTKNECKGLSLEISDTKYRIRGMRVMRFRVHESPIIYSDLRDIVGERDRVNIHVYDFWTRMDQWQPIKFSKVYDH